MSGNAGKSAAHLAPHDNKKKKNQRGRGGLIVITVVLALMIALAGTGAALARTSDSVFPNVYVGGVALGGLSKADAAEALRAGGYESGMNAARADVRL
ncbi:MAG: hypothetical protein LBH17_03125, partial [Oscillospiraceae bacterium]|nr:hypothetical protein [Oscillospiraceae bacterium]